MKKAKLREQIKNLQLENKLIRGKNADLETDISNQETATDNLKCCGNCEYTGNNEKECSKRLISIQPFVCCKDWLNDDCDYEFRERNK